MEENKENKKKIFIAGGNEVTNAKLKALLDKTGKEDNVEFIDMANLPDDIDVVDMSRPYLETLRSMPPMEYKLIQHYVEDMRYSHLSKKEREADILPVRTEPKISRNEPCPCGSGKKYKNCCINKKNNVKLESNETKE